MRQPAMSPGERFSREPRARASAPSLRCLVTGLCCLATWPAPAFRAFRHPHPVPRTFDGGLPELPCRGDGGSNEARAQRLVLKIPGWSRWTRLGTGGELWPAASSLCYWLRDQAAGDPDFLSGADVLELGAGTGAVGIFAAALGASRVLLSDGGKSGLQRLATENAAENRRLGLVPADAQVHAVQYRWGKDLEPLRRTPLTGRSAAQGVPFDWVFGADVTYDCRGHAALCDTIEALLRPAHGIGRPPPRVILAHQHRLLSAFLAFGPDLQSDDAVLANFARESASRHLVVATLRTDRREWHGLGDISVLEVTPEPTP